MFIEKCQGNDKYAQELMKKFIDDFGKYEYELERNMDFRLAVQPL